MNKFLLICSVMVETSIASAFQKMDTKYQISYGNPNAEVQIVEYFSLSCPKCFEFFKEDFQVIKHQYIDTGKISWVFHPDPVDLLTLQAMVCLECLQEEQRSVFMETLIKHLMEKNFKHGSLIMQAAMEILDHPLPDLDKIEFLETTQAFKASVLFLKQKDVISSIPTVEINGKICEEYPTKELLQKKIDQLTQMKKVL